MSMSCGTKDEQRAKQDVEINETLKGIKNKILIMSGKGGVGKSSIAAYLSLFLAKNGHKVGLMDVDLHGPSIPRLLGITKGVLGAGLGKPLPMSVLPNLHVISIEALMGDDKDAALIWRGPIKIGVIRQFISDINWPEMDYLIIDSPPGTGDEPLTVAQTIPDAKSIIVTTPQEVSLADVRKSINFCLKVNMKILGLIENMSGLTCPHCGKSVDLFKRGGGMKTALSHGLKLLGILPIEPELVKIGDTGDISNFDSNGSSFIDEFKKMVKQVEDLTA